MRVILTLMILAGLVFPVPVHARCDYDVEDACEAEIVEMEKANDNYMDTSYNVVIEVTNDTDCTFRNVQLKCDIVNDDGTVLGTQRYTVPGVPPNSFYEVKTTMYLPLYAEPDNCEFEFEFY